MSIKIRYGEDEQLFKLVEFTDKDLELVYILEIISLDRMNYLFVIIFIFYYH